MRCAAFLRIYKGRSQAMEGWVVPAAVSYRPHATMWWSLAPSKPLEPGGARRIAGGILSSPPPLLRASSRLSARPPSRLLRDVGILVSADPYSDHADCASERTHDPLATLCRMRYCGGDPRQRGRECNRDRKVGNLMVDSSMPRVCHR